MAPSDAPPAPSSSGRDTQPPSTPSTTSIVEDHGSYASSCGYCDSNTPTSQAHGMQAHVMSVEDYQALLDRGWRRSGRWMYRPELNDTCCPAFTIRLDVSKFTPTKSQRKVQKKWRAFLDGKLDDDGNRIEVADDDETNAMQTDKDDDKDSKATSRNDAAQKPPKLRVFEIRESPSSFDEAEFNLWKKYQAATHGDDEGSLTKTSYRRFLVDTPLKGTKQCTCSEPEDDQTEWGWIEWDGYQKSSGRKTKNLSGNKTDFSPAPVNGFGSFHHQYLVDGRLIAVGVVDILPKCLSSKYFFWDPQFKWASLGKLSALSEIEWVKTASEKTPSLKYYYLGYYIHDCPKMRYKAEYAPSELKCPVTGLWTLLTTKVGKKIEGGKFTPLREADDPQVLERNKGNGDDGVDDTCAAVSTNPSTGDTTTIPDNNIVGLASGGSLLSVTPFGKAKKGLPKSFRDALAGRIGTWRAATGKAGERILYLVDLDHASGDGLGDKDEENSGSES